MSRQLVAPLLIARAQLAAHGVTVRGAVGYLLVWIAVVLASRVSISVLGIELAPPASSPLDTVAVLMLILPAAVLTRCLRTRTPELDRTRSRARQPVAALWAGFLASVAVVSSAAVSGLLHPAFSTRLFHADWFLTIGLCILLGTVLTTTVSVMAVLAIIAVFSAPGVVPWQANLLYNLELDHVSTPLAAFVFASAVLLAGLRPGDASAFP